MTIVVAGNPINDITSVDGSVTITNPTGPTTDLSAKPGALTLIAKSVLVAPAANFTFAAIPGTFNGLLLKLLARSATAATGDSVNVNLNGDGGANYDVQVFNSGGNATENGRTTAQLTTIAGASSSALASGIMELTIPGYATTVLHKSLTAVGGFIDTGGNNSDGVWVAQWRSAAAINQIVLTLFSGANFVTGSAAYLYGVT